MAGTTGSLIDRITTHPIAYDATFADDIAQTFADQPPQMRELLHGTAGCSGYLAHSMQREAEWLRSVADQPPEAAFRDILANIPSGSTQELSVGLRQAKRRSALLIGLADLGGIWPLETITNALTDLADRAVQMSLSHLIAAEIARGKLPGCTPEDATDAAGMFVVAMGKMGAGELNYSSDIDLIVLFDETRHDPDDYALLRRGFIRVTQQMVKMLSETTGEGYVFRTDLRLRPDPSVTPICIATEPAENYYESVGRTWERAAYIKARVCAGAIGAGEAFLERLTPFVWRRHLDYAAIQDAHDMRVRIRAHKGLTGPLQIPGHDVKLGRGGIREIEFFTQTRQLILGGRNPELRDRRTLPALAALANGGWIDASGQQTLTEAYVAHRTLEHRLQMLEDAQTQKMPKSPESLHRLANFSGYGDVETFTRDLTARFETVHALTEPFFAPEDGQPDTTPELDEVFSDPKRAAELMQAWKRLPALRTERARTIFKRLSPSLLRSLAKSGDADAAITALDGFLSRLPAGVQLFSMMEANPQLLDLLIDICGTTPELARYLGRNSGVLDVVLSQDFFQPLPGTSELRNDLASYIEEADDYETALNLARIWAREHQFRVGVHLLRNLAGIEEAGTGYSAIAEAVLDVILPLVEVEFGRRYGPPPGNGATIVAMGKLGSREMTATSDLDLIVIYDALGEQASDGKRSLPVASYYAKLTQMLIAAITAPMPEGILYKVDMRLRPSGRQGPVATSLKAFETYQNEKAWTWEHLALTRSRVMAGLPELKSAVRKTIEQVLADRGDEETILTDVATMRRRLAEAHDKEAKHPWETKRGPGRIMDIELLAQAGALVCHLNRLRRPSQMIERLGKIGWIPAGDAKFLNQALSRLTALQQVGRLASDHTITPTTCGEGFVRLILSITNTESLEELQKTLETEAARCAEIIEARLGIS